MFLYTGMNKTNPTLNDKCMDVEMWLHIQHFAVYSYVYTTQNLTEQHEV